MPVTQAELDSFHQFAKTWLDTGGPSVTWDDLLVQWESLRNRDDINASIRAGLQDIEAGRHRPGMEVLTELLQKFAIPDE